METSVALERVGHFVRVPVGLPDGKEGRFLLDSGAGLTVVASAVAGRLGLRPTGESFTGRRMSGQSVTAPLSSLPSLSVADVEVSDLTVGVADMGPTEGDEGFDGILGLGTLRDWVVTVDPFKAIVLLQQALEMAPGDMEIPVCVERQEPSVCLFTDLQLSTGRVVQVEIDTGSGALILDDRYLGDCGVEPGQDEIETLVDTDETGFEYVRRFATAKGRVQLAGQPATVQSSPRTMFQDIIHDGLLGTDFLDRFTYSFDVRGQRLVLRPTA
ncbi:MAG: retropepsin-like aspartic protease [Nocardioidaceae bacterium]